MRPNSTPEEATEVVTEHQVVRDRMASFSTSAKGLISAASRSRGYLDGGMERRPDGSATWLVICRFDSSENAEVWTRSRSNAVWLEYIDRFSVRVGTRTSAMSTTPAVPARPGPPRPPPRWKMAVATLTGVFPAVLLVNLTVIPVPQVAGLPFILRTLVLCVCVTGLMTWVLMPQVQKLLGPWLRRGTAPPVVPSESAAPSPAGPHALRAPAMPPDSGVRPGVRTAGTARPRHSAPATSSPRGRPSPSRSR